MVMVDLSNKVADTVLSPVYFNIFSKKTSGSIEVKFFGAFIIRRDNTFIIVLVMLPKWRPCIYVVKYFGKVYVAIA